MQKFNKLKSIPAYLPIVNIDTDMIIPKQFLKTIKRTGLGKNLFFEMRYDDQGKEVNDFTLNQSPFNNSKILIAGKNFGCGSSREHAPWALLDFGITCVISSSYADIFYSNCFKNGILPIILEEEKIVKTAYQSTEISDSIKKNFSFVWYQFYKFLFIFTNRWRKELGDLETFTIGVIVLVNAAENKTFKLKEFDRKKYQISIQGSDERGVNAMSLAEITGIPRTTVIRKLKILIKKDLLQINEKNLITINMKGEGFKTAQKLQDKNMLSLSNFISRAFNQLKIIN